MKITELQFSDITNDFHTWCRKHNKKAVLVIQNLETLTNALGVYKKAQNDDVLEFISQDLKLRLSIEKVYMSDKLSGYVLSQYLNVHDNFIYLMPFSLYEIDEMFLLKNS